MHPVWLVSLVSASFGRPTQRVTIQGVRYKPPLWALSCLFSVKSLLLFCQCRPFSISRNRRGLTVRGSQKLNVKLAVKYPYDTTYHTVCTRSGLPRSSVPCRAPHFLTCASLPSRSIFICLICLFWRDFVRLDRGGGGWLHTHFAVAVRRRARSRQASVALFLLNQTEIECTQRLKTV